MKRAFNRDRIVGTTLLAIAVSYGLLGRDLPLLIKGRLAAGFFPLIITILLVVSALSMLIRPGHETVEMPTREEFAILGRTLGTVAFTVLIMPYVGFLVATFVLLVLTWLPTNDPARRIVRLILVAVITLAAYATFRLLLNVQLPKSALGF